MLGTSTISTSRLLPAPLTSFVGRANELTELIERLRTSGSRLFTIVGAGGVGKTRLALEAARANAADPAEPFAHGVAMVSLAALAQHNPSPDLLATTIASAMGIALSGPETVLSQVAEYFHAKSLLLLLDNFEPALSGAAILTTLLEAAPELTILATSRERLNVHGEQVVELSGLPFPARTEAIARGPSRAAEPKAVDIERYDAVQLFVQSAQAAEPTFELTDAAVPAVARICQLVEGLPLGIELAATWVRVLSPDEIAQEIRQSLDFLSSSTHGLPARQQSIRAVFDYSWNLLSDAERVALGRLSVFASQFTREAATAILGLQSPRAASTPEANVVAIRGPQVLMLLASLVDKSLIHRVGVGSAARYEVLVLLQQYAAEKLEETGQTAFVAESYARFYGEQIAKLSDALRGSEQKAALDAIDLDFEHVRAAWRWAVAQTDIELIGRMVNGLFHFYDMRSWFREGEAAFAAASNALAGATDDGARMAYARVLARQGWFTFHLGRQAEARDALEQSLALLRALDARAELIFALNYLGAVYSYLGEYQRTNELCRESVALAEALGDLSGKAIGCNILGQAAYALGTYDEAKRWHQQSLAIEQQTGNRWSMAYSLTNLGRIAYTLHEYDEARRLFQQSLDTRQAIGDIRGVANCFSRLGDIAVAQGNPAEAGERYVQSLDLFREIGNEWGMASSLVELGKLAVAQKRDAAALSLLREAVRIALAIQAAPLVAQGLQAVAPVLRQHSEHAWANELTLLNTVDFAQLHPHAERLRGWLASSFAPLAVDAAVSEARKSAAVEDSSASAKSPASAQARPTTAKTYPGGLTPREISVLQLVAQGLTDVQVAEQLVVSPRTVSTHLTSIYSKLSVSSRTAATRFAVENDLI